MRRADGALSAYSRATTSWLTQHFQSREKRLSQEASRRERVFVSFVDQASQTYAHGMVQEGLDDPSRLVPLYATINKLRLFAAPNTIRAAETVLDAIVKAYHAPGSALTSSDLDVAAHDILRGFAELCRAELKALR